LGDLDTLVTLARAATVTHRSQNKTKYSVWKTQNMSMIRPFT